MLLLLFTQRGHLVDAGANGFHHERLRPIGLKPEQIAIHPAGLAVVQLMAEIHKPDIGILAAGGHFTMDMERAAYAANRYFNFKTVIPCHYKTFPLLAQSADTLIAALPDVDVIEPEVLTAIEI